jgi:uncharacterized membrane protein YfcA
MDIHLPIAGLSIDIFLLFGLGGAVGILSGMFGVGGGFLLTPMLIFIGVPAPVAVGSDVCEVLGASVSGLLAHWRRGNVDFRMGGVLLGGGLIGSTLGALAFKLLRNVGQIDLTISLAYVAFLGMIGAFMAVESGRALLRYRRGAPPRPRRRRHLWVHKLPLKVRFRRSRLYISAIPPFAIGLVVGVLAAILGIGGGFVMVPAMIYLLGMPTAVVVGTSLFQIVFVTANVTFLHAVNTQTVDVILALVLLVGAAVGAQLGARIVTLLRAEQLRGLLALLVLAVAVRLAYALFATPESMFALQPLAGH